MVMEVVLLLLAVMVVVVVVVILLRVLTCLLTQILALGCRAEVKFFHEFGRQIVNLRDEILECVGVDDAIRRVL